jgi:ABC-type nitrate/sulfonate/bicarbonate transport system permease component
MLGPLINFLFAIVEVAWIPIFVLWWGYGIKTILVALCYVVFFPCSTTQYSACAWRRRCW